MSVVADFSYTARQMKAEEKLLERFKHDWTPMTMEEMMAYVGENKRAIEVILTQIKRYPGYKVEANKHWKMTTTYQIIYDEQKDPWVNSVGGESYAY